MLKVIDEGSRLRPTDIVAIKLDAKFRNDIPALQKQIVDRSTGRPCPKATAYYPALERAKSGTGHPFPTLSRGDIVIMDNLCSHKTRAVRAADPRRRRPPAVPSACSPDLNPIKQAFAKLKHFLRKDQPRIRDDLWKNIGSILKRFEPEECANYLANSRNGVLQTKRKTL